jgi:hypothetical protein
VVVASVSCVVVDFSWVRTSTYFCAGRGRNGVVSVVGGSRGRTVLSDLVVLFRLVVKGRGSLSVVLLGGSSQALPMMIQCVMPYDGLRVIGWEGRTKQATSTHNLVAALLALLMGVCLKRCAFSGSWYDATYDPRDHVHARVAQ